MNKVLSVQVTGPCDLICELSNKKLYRFDMGFVLREDSPMVKPLRDPAFFAKVFLENGHLTWPNGYDIHADTIVRDGIPLNQEAS